MPTIIVDNAHVRYRVYEDRRAALRTIVATRGRARVRREIHAVKGISFTAHAGEVIGVIGRNGSGKSTLMQAMAGLLPVTDGTIHARSDPVMLGVGAALQRVLSGRRNIELGCLALGMTNKEVAARLDHIVRFSGLEQFIDLPLRTYSSGMRARLHFSIATATRPDILLIDEALAVGDAGFRRRSERRIRKLRRNAGTVFIVSHRLGEIRRNCTRVLWIDQGQLIEDGKPKRVLKAYRSSVTAERRRRRRRRARRRQRQDVQQRQEQIPTGSGARRAEHRQAKASAQGQPSPS